MTLQNTSHLHTDLDRHDRLLQERLHDPYHAKLKLQEPSVCPECGAVFHKGRWTWGDAPAGAHNAMCHEQRERAEHPLKRIMAVEDFDGGIRLSFTEAHLARDIGEAVHHAYKGELAYHYADEDIMLRVNWTRD
jgi:hypothetical protein